MAAAQTDCTHTQPQPIDILALLPARVQHFLSPFSAYGPCASTERSSKVPADRTCWPSTHGTRASHRTLLLCLQHQGPTVPAPSSTSRSRASRQHQELTQQNVPVFPLELYLRVGKRQLLKHSVVWGFTVYGYSLFIIIKGVINHQRTCRENKL